MRVPFKGLKNVPWQKDLICSVSLQRVEPDPRSETLRAAQNQLNIKNKHANLFFFFLVSYCHFKMDWAASEIVKNPSRTGKSLSLGL